MSQRESVVLMDFFEILDGFTKSFDQDFTGQGRTKAFSRPKCDRGLPILHGFLLTGIKEIQRQKIS